LKPLKTQALAICGQKGSLDQYRERAYIEAPLATARGTDFASASEGLLNTKFQKSR
jgi:hypothetical protein